MKPRGKPFEKGTDPRRNKDGQRNKSAVAFARSLRDLIITEGNKQFSVTVSGKITKDKKIAFVMRSLYAKAMAGDMEAIKFIADRVEGKVKELIEHSGGINLDHIDVVIHDGGNSAHQ